MIQRGVACAERILVERIPARRAGILRPIGDFGVQLSREGSGGKQNRMVWECDWLKNEELASISPWLGWASRGIL
jgi:hypothetical protein